MKAFFKERKFVLFVSLYSIMCALFWTALRVNYAGISKFLGADKNQSFFILYLPVFVLVFMWFIAILSILSLCFSKKKTLSIILLVFDIIETGICLATIYFGAYDYLDFILPKFYLTTSIALLIMIIGLFIFLPFEHKKAGNIIKVIFILIILGSSLFFTLELKPNSITYDSVVYAVDDTYQIVFSTSSNSTAWVTIGDNTYYDLYSGSMKSKDKVHKIVVPQNILDDKKEYTINAERIIYRGPFGGFKGKVISKTHKFIPVDTSDGISYYTMSDVHGCYEGAINSAKSTGKLDFVILLGDITSMVEYERDANFANKLAYEITKGEIPVIYLRGNHEIKGKYAEELYKYVGSKNQNYYYTFTLSNIYGVCLDLGEDHDDDWWEYYETAQFDLYRDEQTAFLESIVENKEYDNYDYKMVLCHIPVNFVNSRHNHEKYKYTWTELINEIAPNIFLSGHQHDVTPLIPGVIKPYTTLKYNKNYKGDGTKEYNGYLTAFTFYGFISSRPFQDDQTSKDIMLGKSHYTGLYINAKLDEKKQYASFINSNGEKVSVCNMYGTDEPIKEFVYPIY